MTKSYTITIMKRRSQASEHRLSLHIAIINVKTPTTSEVRGKTLALGQKQALAAFDRDDGVKAFRESSHGADRSLPQCRRLREESAEPQKAVVIRHL